jgi:hypothetical protein
MYVKHLQEYLDKFTNGKKGNAVSNAKIFIYVNGYLEEIKRIEVHSRGPWSKVLENFFTIPVPWFKDHGA